MSFFCGMAEVDGLAIACFVDSLWLHACLNAASKGGCGLNKCDIYLNSKPSLYMKSYLSPIETSPRCRSDLLPFASNCFFSFQVISVCFDLLLLFFKCLVTSLLLFGFYLSHELHGEFAKVILCKDNYHLHFHLNVNI